MFSSAMTFYPTPHSTPLCLFFHYFLATFNALEAIDLAKERRRTREKRWERCDYSFFFGLNMKFSPLIKGLHVQGLKTLAASYFSVAK